MISPKIEKRILSYTTQLDFMTHTENFDELFNHERMFYSVQVVSVTQSDISGGGL